MMKHIVSVGPMHSVVAEMADLPPITADEIRIRNKLVGVCRSEHDAWKTAQPGQAFGHEPMGCVAEVGANVKDWRVGDRIAGMWGGTLPGSGGFCEYANVNPAHNNTLMHVPDGLRDDEVMVEPLACIFSAVSKVRKGVPGTPVAVVGCGYMGCGAISLLKACGAYVVAIDIRPECLKFAAQFGADETYLADEAREKFEARVGFNDTGFAAVMEWGETNESLDLAIHITRMCGQLCIGAYHTGGKRLVDVQRLNLFAIDCLSTHPREPELSRQGAHSALRMLASGEWKFRGVPTMIYPRNQFDRAQAELETKYGRFIKSAIDMTMADGEPYLVGV